MEKRRAAARQVVALEKTAAGQDALKEQLDRIEAKLDQLLAERAEEKARQAAIEAQFKIDAAQVEARYSDPKPDPTIAAQEPAKRKKGGEA